MRAWGWLVAVVASVGLLGCQGEGEFKTADQLPAPSADDHGHDHGHGHGEEGPHHGALVELGEEEFHAEIVLDPKTHTLKVYVLGPDAKTAAATTATEVTITPEGGSPLVLKAASEQPEGGTSLFELTDETALHDLIEAEFLHGQLAIRVGEKDFDEFVDAHFDHDHAH